MSFSLGTNCHHIETDCIVKNGHNKAQQRKFVFITTYDIFSYKATVYTSGPSRRQSRTSQMVVFRN